MDDDFLDHDDPSMALTECADLFVKGDYQRCFEKVMGFIRKMGISLLPVQLAVISSQRLGNEDDAEGIGTAMLDRPDIDPLEKLLFRISLGQGNTAALALQAQSGGSENRCRAFFYYGNRLLTIGEEEKARETLRGCVATVASSLDEYQLALSQLASWDTNPESIRRLTRLKDEDIPRVLAEGKQLNRSGQHQEALGCFDRILATSPNHAEALVGKAEALLALGRNQEAFACSIRARSVLGIDDGGGVPH